MKPVRMNIDEALGRFPAYDLQTVDQNLKAEIALLNRKIIVLDDDPTGVQTVHGVHVYTDWTCESISQGFDEENAMFFLLTNSRGFTAEQTKKVHEEIASNVVEVSKKKNKDFLIISRSDSTLRGHYPLETQTLRTVLEERTGKKIDGEILYPFFLEGGRFTIDHVHYVSDGGHLVPAAETEFARDKTFGYNNSDLCAWIEEKTRRKYPCEAVVTITLNELRNMDYDGIFHKLMAVQSFNKIVVDAIEYADTKVFVTALIRAIRAGKRFLFRSAAALTKIMGDVSDKPLLTKDELINTTNENGGVIIVGSHVKKTTQQLEMLKTADSIEFVEFNQHLVVDDDALATELARVKRIVESNITQGRTVAVYTRRERFDLNTGNKEDELRYAVKISDSITSIISDLTVRPNFIVAKGGITSSDVGTKGLLVKKALVLGQVLYGVPVWLTGPESRFPNMPYVIFPGNVGNESALLDVVNIMTPMAP